MKKLVNSDELKDAFAKLLRRLENNGKVQPIPEGNILSSLPLPICNSTTAVYEGAERVFFWDHPLFGRHQFRTQSLNSSDMRQQTDAARDYWGKIFVHGSMAMESLRFLPDFVELLHALSLQEIPSATKAIQEILDSMRQGLENMEVYFQNLYFSALLFAIMLQDDVYARTRFRQSARNKGRESVTTRRTEHVKKSDEWLKIAKQLRAKHPKWSARRTAGHIAEAYRRARDYEDIPQCASIPIHPDYHGSPETIRKAISQLFSCSSR